MPGRRAGKGPGVLHLRLIAPPASTDRVREVLAGHRAVTHLAIVPGAGREPEGDLVLADVAREAAGDVIDRLKALGLEEHGCIAVSGIDLSLSARARRAEREAPGHGSDALVAEDLIARTGEESQLSVVFLVFMVLATVIAGVAVLLDNPILIVGAMIVGPEFGPLAAICAGTVLGRGRGLRPPVTALLVGFPVGMAVTVVFTWGMTALGLLDEGMLSAERPATAFIYDPDALSFVVAFLAGIAGMLSLTSAKSSALLGVLVSVTTIPAAGNAAVALAYGALDETRWSLVQLLLNVGGILLAGVTTLWVQQRLLARYTWARR